MMNYNKEPIISSLPFVDKEFMPRFLLNPCGTAGDVHPYLAVGRELFQRGHEVFLLTNPVYEEAAKDYSLQFVPIGDRLDWTLLRKDSRVHNARHSWKAAMQWGATGTMREVFEAIRKLNEPGATVVAAPAWSLGARIAQEALSIPLATCVLNPFLLRSVYQSPITPQMFMPDWMPRWMKRFQLWVGDTFFVEPLMGKTIREFRNELGLPEVRRWMNRWWFSPDLVLGLFNESYVPTQPDWQCQVEFVGHTVTDPVGDLSVNARVQEFLDSGARPICFVPGSVGPGSPVFYQAAIEACEKLGMRGLILDKTEQGLGVALPPFMFHATYSPLRSVLPKCNAIVHSGCSGTAAQGLLAGTPQLVRPCVNDQPDMAQRLKRLGVSRTILPKQFNTMNLVHQLRSLLDDASLLTRCREVQAIVSKDAAVIDICDHLEKLLEPTNPPRSELKLTRTA